MLSYVLEIVAKASRSEILHKYIQLRSSLFLLSQMIQQHQEWLEDLVIRLLCVFALDRFGDFVSDEVSCLSEQVIQQASAGEHCSRSAMLCPVLLHVPVVTAHRCSL